MARFDKSSTLLPYKHPSRFVSGSMYTTRMHICTFIHRAHLCTCTCTCVYTSTSWFHYHLEAFRHSGVVSHLSPTKTPTIQRVEVPNIEGLWSQKPYPEGYLGPESLNIGYLDTLRIITLRLQRTQIWSSYGFCIRQRNYC